MQTFVTILGLVALCYFIIALIGLVVKWILIASIYKMMGEIDDTFKEEEE
jgi:hypothetical protein